MDSPADQPARTYLVMAPLHGTRRCYQDQDCRCEACRAANRRYQAHYRDAQRAGRPVLGTHGHGKEAARILASLLEHDYQRGDIATWLGYRWPVFHWQAGDGATLRMTLRLRWFARHLEV